MMRIQRAYDKRERAWGGFMPAARFYWVFFRDIRGRSRTAWGKTPKDAVRNARRIHEVVR